jgi:predicted alpha/beta-fold hydrolase
MDDPFVRITRESRAALLANPAITLMEPAHGGHCAFLAQRNPAAGDDGYWAEATVLQFLKAADRVTPPSTPSTAQASLL